MWQPNATHLVFLRTLACAVLLAMSILGLKSDAVPRAKAQSGQLTLDSWQRHVIDDARPARAVFIDGGDINGDGWPDVVTGNSWYVNPGTPDGSWSRRTVGQPLNNMAALYDFDNDGKLDVLGSQGVGSSSNSAFVWAKNDGSGNFTLYENFGTTQGNFLQGVSVNRFQAGDQLQVAISWQDANVGTQLLTVPVDPVNETWTWEVASTSAFGEDLSSADIDRNGTVDLVLGTRWLQNDGSNWIAHTVNGPLDGGPDRNELADINQDGRIDAVVGSSRAGREGVLYWYEQPTVATDRWEAHLISDTVIGGGMSLDVADMDNDGDFDVVLGEHSLVVEDEAELRLIIFENLDGQGSSWAPHVVYIGDEHHDGSRVIDIDRDGDYDILSIGWSHNKVLLYENKAIDSRRPVEPVWRTISSEDGSLPAPSGSTEQTAALVLDVDKDGVNDFIIGNRRDPGPAIVWYRRTDTAWQRYVIESGVFPIEAGGAYHDIDGDGDLDIVFGGDATSNGIWWWENPHPSYAPNTSWTRHPIKTNGVNKHHDMVFGDFDGDNRTELAFWNQRAKQLVMAEIPPDPRTSGPWTLIPIYSYTDTEDSHEGLFVADIDLDGKHDLVGGGRWFKHLGGSNYSVNIIDDAQTTGRAAAGQLIPGGRPEIVFVPGETSGPLKWYRWNGINWIGTDPLGVSVTRGHSLDIADINQDGNLDIFVAEMRLDGGNEDAKMRIFYGDGRGKFRAEVVSTGIGNHESRVADLDGDGDYDILGKPYNWDTPRIDVWLNINGKLSVDRWRRHVIDNDRPWRAIFIVPGDVDGDKKPDIIAGAWWYRNPGRPDGLWTRNEIGTPLNNMAAVYDFDNDGALDIIGTAGKGSDRDDSFSWAHNDGTGNFIIYQNVDDGDGPFLQGALVDRFSSQGPLEVVLSWQKGETGLQSLIVPDDPLNERWAWRLISPVSQGEGIDSADMDRDGDQDIILGTQWLRNDSDSFSPFTLHNPDTGDPDRVHLADIDRDGDLDAVVGYGHDPNGKLVWYERPDDVTQLWTEHLMANLVNPQSVDVADLDQDGDLDIVVGEHNINRPEESQLIIYENEDGRGGTWQTHLIHVGDEHHDGAQFVDIDQDGDLDIISTGWVQNRVLIYENLAIGSIPANAAPLADAGPDQTVIDTDGDEQELVQFDGSGSTDDGTIVEYSWRINGEEFTTGQTAEALLPIGEHTVTLAVTDDKGTSTVDSVQISVWSREPAIQSQPQDRVVVQGFPAVFAVEATGAQILSFQWQRDGVNIPGATNAEYTIDNTSLDDTGSVVRVVITNEYGAVMSEEVSLHVLESRSDDFNSCALNEALWTFHDPQAEGSGASTVTVDGRRLILSVPGGVDHDVWRDGIKAPYVTMPMSNTDFEIETKFESSVEFGFQLQGVLVLEDEENLVRFNIQHDGNAVRLLGIKFEAGVPSIEINRSIPSGGAPFYLRIARSGDEWQAAYSYDGTEWTGGDAFRFSHALSVKHAGLFAGNVGRDNPAPAVNMLVDYFMDVGNPLSAEDHWVLAPDELDVIAVPGDAGNVSVAPNAGAACSEMLKLTALPVPGWSFDRWVGGSVEGTENPVTGQFTTDDRIEAHFVEIEQFPLVVTIESNGAGTGGTVSREPDKPAYLAGEVVTLQAQAAPGWRFDGWSEDIVSTESTVQVKIEQATQVTAAFTQERFTLQTQTSGPGSGEIILTPQRATYAPGERVILEAVPAAGSYFDRWGGDVSGSARIVEVIMNDSLSVTARFGEEAYTLSVNASGNGQIIVEPEQTVYTPGARITLTAVPDAGWRFVVWSGHVAGNDNPITLVMNATKTVWALFQEAEPAGEDMRVFLPIIQK